MAPPDSFLWTLADHVRGFLETGLAAASHQIHVSIGTPSLTADDPDFDQVNLFFHRFEPSGFESEGSPQEPWRLRIFCVITAMGAGRGDELAGENDLRLLGNVIRIFHQSPIMDAVAVDGETVRLLAVFMPLTEETINQIWSTQGDATYRPSVAYELALAPVVPQVRRTPSPLVGEVGGEALSAVDSRTLHARSAGQAGAPLLPARQVDPQDPEWAPLLCWVQDGECRESISHAADSGPFEPRIWLAGVAGASLDLVWERWDSATGWQALGVSGPLSPDSTGIDPLAVPEPLPASFTRTPPQPLELPDGSYSRQYLVHARRSLGGARVVRSTPLLLTLYRERP